jgi:hypothetical protein
MATVLEDNATEEQSLCAKALYANYIHKETFLVYGGKCLLHEAFHNCFEKRDENFAGGKEVKSEVRK